MIRHTTSLGEGRAVERDGDAVGVAGDSHAGIEVDECGGEPTRLAGLRAGVMSASLVRGRSDPHMAQRTTRIGSYNGIQSTYNAGMTAASHVMTISRNGQVSIPAEARSRWKARRVVVVDLGDRVVMRPLAEDPVGDLEGKYRGRGPDTERARQRARRADDAHERRR